jgi:4a-hydroxytetrahydrobiopterin dehydratase
MWLTINNQLYKQFQFANFSEAFAFMVQVAFLAEKLNHHPTWNNSYNVVNIYLCTHDANNTITAKDTLLAEQIDALLL